MFSTIARCAAAGVAAAIVITSAHAQTPGVTADTLVLGRILPLTGVLAGESKIYAEGMDVLFERINKSGGINGRRIVVRNYDDAYAADRAAIAAKTALEQDQVLLLLGGLGTANGLTIAALAEESRTALIGTTTGAVAFRDPARRYVFPVWPSNSDEVNRMVAIGSRIGWETYAAVFQDDAFGKDALAGLQVGAARERAVVSATIPVDRAKPDLDGAVAAAVRSKASVVMVFLPPGPATRFIKALKEAGYTGAVATLSINGIPAVIKGIGEKSRGLALPRVLPRPTDSTNPLAAEFMKVMKEAGKTDPQPGHFSAYVVARVAVEALKRAGRNVNREGVVNALESFGELDIGAYTIAYGGNKLRQGVSPTRIELQVVGKGGGFVY
jgi:ABC-type branched-subunit amino acid transport system substrate-binding protein